MYWVLGLWIWLFFSIYRISLVRQLEAYISDNRQTFSYRRKLYAMKDPIQPWGCNSNWIRLVQPWSAYKIIWNICISVAGLQTPLPDLRKYCWSCQIDRLSGSRKTQAYFFRVSLGTTLECTINKFAAFVCQERWDNFSSRLDKMHEMRDLVAITYEIVRLFALCVHIPWT